MRLFGLIGNPLTHSFSETYFKNKFRNEDISDADFKLFTLEKVEDIYLLIEKNPYLQGFSVTIPFKEKIIGLLDEIDPIASEIGAVNVVKVFRNKNKITLSGFNTDIVGFEYSLNLLSIDKKNIKALVLGNGGASKAVVFVLRKLNIPFVIVSRNPVENQLNYKQISKTDVENFKLIINTTPLGMFPDINSCPLIPYKYITSSHFLIDLVYNPTVTKFLELGKEKDSVIMNGIIMLERQAEAAWEIWNK